MKHVIGIRREDKNEWEQRVPLIPEDLEYLMKEYGIPVVVQSSPIRAFTDDEYRAAGVRVEDDLSACPVVFAVKEIPSDLFTQAATYVFFSHTIKGQAYNLPMLKRLMELKCNLIDYETIADEHGRRLIFFGRYAGLAGMLETLWGLGKRLAWAGKESPFARVDHAYRYGTLETARTALQNVGLKIKQGGISADIAPLIIGFAGYGHVSRGAQEILDFLPTIEISPGQIEDVFKSRKDDLSHIYKVVFKEEDLVAPISTAARFELQDYYQHPEKYRSKMEDYLPYLTVLLNCIYWEAQYPRILTKAFVKKLYAEGTAPALKIVGDISCDIEGAIECTTRLTKPDEPVFLYQPHADETTPGWEGEGLAVIAVDNLPCELPRESSAEFSKALMDYIPAIAEADFSQRFEACQLPAPIKRAVILYHGELTEPYQYIQHYM
jgi:alpha-aminoadipic semialdehyde synthase